MRNAENKKSSDNGILSHKTYVHKQEKKMLFHVYRYQLPLVNGIIDEPSLNSEHLSAQESKKQKNRIFAKYLKDICGQLNALTEGKYSALFIAEQENLLFVRIGKKATTSLTDISLTKSHKEEHYNHQIILIFDNDPNKQILAVEKSGYIKFSTLEKSFLKVLKLKLESAFLTLECQPISSSKNFWQIIDNENNKITSLKFTVFAENMASDIKEVANIVSDIRGIMKADQSSFQSEAKNGLNIEHSNQAVDAMHKCSQSGLGNLILFGTDSNDKKPKKLFDSSSPKLADSFSIENQEIEKLIKTVEINQRVINELISKFNQWKIEQK